jgi:uncharacterized protein
MVAWRGIDDPLRVERSSIVLEPDRLRAIGASHTSFYATSWDLEVAAGWITDTLRVSVHGPRWWRTLTLSRTSRGDWDAEIEHRGDPDLPAPGLADPSTLLGAVDCDLGLCPVTNTMPIRRLELLDRHVDETRLTMAWVEVPSLRVIRSDQVYASGSGAEGGGPEKGGPESVRYRSVRYKSYRRDFSAELTVDDDGIVIDYPGLARRIVDDGA